AVLTRHFLRHHGAKHGNGAGRPEVTPAGLDLLRDHPWPGNVRELSHVLEAAMILAETALLDREHLAAVLQAMDPGAPRPPARDDPDQRSGGGRYSFFGTEDEEREAIRSVLSRCRGNRTRTALELGMARNTLRARMRKYGL
ncbi:MAG TPA: helix-turn-helix domain-containing protein, partial [Longimicrobiales bacterium]